MSGQVTRREFVRNSTAMGLFAASGTVRAVAAPAESGARKSAPSLPVAIQRCGSYQPASLIAKVSSALDLIGGIERLVRDKTVTIKLNLTGDPRGKLGGMPAYRTYQVHPNFVAATCAAFDQAGAKRINPLHEISTPTAVRIVRVVQVSLSR